MIAKSFKELLIWQKAIDLAEIVYRLTEKFPQAEKFGLVSQIRRASVSVSSNIAEGFVRKHTAEFKNFLSISLGSLAELESQIILSERLAYSNSQDIHDIVEAIEILGKMVTKFRQQLR